MIHLATDKEVHQMEETRIVVLGDEYSIDKATKTMRGHVSWLYWIAGLSLANLLYIVFDQGYFMVAGLGLNSFVADWLADSEEQVFWFKLAVGFSLVVYFTVSGYLALTKKRIMPVVIATIVYALDAILFATVYFDIVSLLFHIWATFSLMIGASFMIKLRPFGQQGSVFNDTSEQA
jgi:hypothetical protein